MPWFKVDDNFAFHAKAVAAGNPALGMWVRAGAWAAQNLTEGLIPHHMLPAFGTPAQARKLCAVGLWHLEDTGYRFHEWGERQPSKADVEAERAAGRERMRAVRARKKTGTQTPSSQVSHSRAPEHLAQCGECSGEVRKMFGLPHPDPSRPSPARPSIPMADHHVHGSTADADTWPDEVGLG